MSGTIRFLLFIVIFLSVMSVSFLVEAHDVPVGAKASALEVVKDESDEPQDIVPYTLSDVPDGLASWYGKGFHGRRTASGRRYDMNDLTAAHKSLPFGTLLRVVNAKTGETVIVEVTDRGPFVKRRVVDLSFASAKLIGVSVTPVQLEAITPADVERFYSTNTKGLLVINNALDVQVCPFNRVTVVKTFDSFSQASRNRQADEHIVMTSAFEGKTAYATARILSPEISYLD